MKLTPQSNLLYGWIVPVCKESSLDFKMISLDVSKESPLLMRACHLADSVFILTEKGQALVIKDRYGRTAPGYLLDVSQYYLDHFLEIWNLHMHDLGSHVHYSESGESTLMAGSYRRRY